MRISERQEELLLFGTATAWPPKYAHGDLRLGEGHGRSNLLKHLRITALYLQVPSPRIARNEATQGGSNAGVENHPSLDRQFDPKFANLISGCGFFLYHSLDGWLFEVQVLATMISETAIRNVELISNMGIGTLTSQSNVNLMSPRVLTYLAPRLNPQLILAHYSLFESALTHHSNALPDFTRMLNRKTPLGTIEVYSPSAHKRKGGAA